MPSTESWIQTSRITWRNRLIAPVRSLQGSIRRRGSSRQSSGNRGMSLLRRRSLRKRSSENATVCKTVRRSPWRKERRGRGPRRRRRRWVQKVDETILLPLRLLFLGPTVSSEWARKTTLLQSTRLLPARHPEQRDNSRLPPLPPWTRESTVQRRRVRVNDVEDTL